MESPFLSPQPGTATGSVREKMEALSTPAKLIYAGIGPEIPAFITTEWSLSQITFSRFGSGCRLSLERGTDTRDLSSTSAQGHHRCMALTRSNR